MNLYHTCTVMSVYWMKFTNKRVRDAPKRHIVQAAIRLANAVIKLRNKESNVRLS